MGVRWSGQRGAGVGSGLGLISRAVERGTAMSYISGDGVVQGPAKIVQMTPEQEAHSERKRLAARERRANLKVAGELPEPVVEQVAEQSPEAAETPELPWERG